MNTKEFSLKAGINQEYVRRLIKNGTVQATQTFHGYEITQAELEKYKARKKGKK